MLSLFFRLGDASTLDWIHLWETGKSFMNTQHRKRSDLFTLTRGSEGGPKVLKSNNSDHPKNIPTTNEQHQDTMSPSLLTLPKIPSTFSSWGRPASPATEVRLHETFFHEEEEGRFFCLVCEVGMSGIEGGMWISGTICGNIFGNYL